MDEQEMINMRVENFYSTKEDKCYKDIDDYRWNEYNEDFEVNFDWDLYENLID